MVEKVGISCDQLVVFQRIRRVVGGGKVFHVGTGDQLPGREVLFPDDGVRLLPDGGSGLAV